MGATLGRQREVLVDLCRLEEHARWYRRPTWWGPCSFGPAYIPRARRDDRPGHVSLAMKREGAGAGGDYLATAQRGTSVAEDSP